MGKLFYLLAAAILITSCAHAQIGQTYDIYANDGTYLGNTSNNQFDPNSINNPYGQYGSQYSPKSIRNPYGQYGSQYSPTSPNNPYAPQPNFQPRGYGY